MAINEQFKGALKSALLSVTLLLGGFWFWHSLFGNPFDDFALITRGRTTPGFIVDTWEDVDSSDDGRTHWSHGAAYTYRRPDGQQITNYSKTKPGRLKSDLRDLERPRAIEVEYLPDAPDVSRMKGEGSSTVLEWLWREIVLGGVLLAVFLAPGVGVLRRAVTDLRRNRYQTVCHR